MKNLLRNLASVKVRRLIKIGGEVMKDKLEWILAFIVVYGGIFVFLVGGVYTCRGIHSFVVDVLSKLI